MMRKWYASVLVACCASSALALPSSPRLPQRPFFYSTNGSTVADALDALSQAVHVPVRIEGGAQVQVQGPLAGRYDMRPEQFLDVLAASFDLVWYYDGAVIHIEPDGARTSVAMQFNFATAADVKARLESERVEDARMPVAVDAKRNTLSVSGPASYVDRISQVARRTEDDARARVDTVVRTVPLKYENAADRILAVGGQTVTAPGLAARLQRRVRGADGVDGNPVTAKASAQMPPAKLLQFDVALPIFEADARTNSILVRDRAERIDADQELVKRFDSKPRAMSIHAYVFDVDDDVFPTLDLNPPDSDGGDAHDGQMLVHDGAAALLAQVRTLERAGKARVRIDRNLVTVDHAPVSIDRREFVSVEQLGASKEGDEKDAHQVADNATSVVVEPDLSGQGSASLFHLLTTVRDAGGAPLSTRSADGVDRSRQHDEQRTQEAVRTTLASGDALVLFAKQGESSGSADGQRRLVVLVPTPIDG